MARHGRLLAVKVAGKDLTRPAPRPGERGRPVLVVRLDATLVEAASPKAQVARTCKRGFGFHPLTAWCSNIGDSLAVMLRPGNAGSFTACDHIAVCDAAFGQIPAPWRADVLVSIDGAGASHEIIDHLSGLNTAVVHGNRGRRVEYTIGWPVDERTLGGISELRQRDWGQALAADGVCRPRGGVADLTGILRAGPGGDRLTGWPTDPRVIARRVPRPAGKPAKLGEDADWEYGAFATNTPTGQLQWLDARHRTGPRRGPGQTTQGPRRPQPALHRLRPQRRLAPTRRAGHVADRLAAPPGPGRRPRQARDQDPAIPAPVRPGPPHHPRQTQDLESPTRLEMGPRPGHRLGTPASPAPRLTPPPPTRPTKHHPAEPWKPAPTRAPSGPSPYPRSLSTPITPRNTDDHEVVDQRE